MRAAFRRGVQVTVVHATGMGAAAHRPPGPKETAVDAPDEALVDADEHLLALALTNLFENASKYGGGARAVRLSRVGNGVRISVVDDGAGLDPAARDRIFERYWRESASVAGSGIGLALVRAVAERHGGKADARAAVGGGLYVGFTVAPLIAWHGGEPGEARAGDHL